MTVRLARSAALLIALLCAGLGTTRAQREACNFLSPCQTYLPIIQTEPPPPPPLSTLVLQPTDMTGYALTESREITNTAAAAGYQDPVAAAAAFEAQGRESSWYAQYVSRTRPIGVASQVIRYRTSDGADAGMDYAVADERLRYTYGDLVDEPLGDRAVACLALFVRDGVTYKKLYYAIRKGRHVALIQIIARQYTIVDDTDIALAATARLP